MQFYHWWLAIRPKTLSISVTPVVVGTALAWSDSGAIQWLPAIAALVAALLIQIGTNLHNDAADFERGSDGPDRIGPRRAAAEGWFTAAEIKRAAYLSFCIAFIIGIYLAWIGGWPIVAIGLLSLAAGYAYTGGPKPIAYSASGELFVFLFFGLAAVMGSYYIQTLSLSLNSLLIATAIGLMAAAVLTVNNYRDLEQDRKSNKLTLIHYLGRNRSRYIYAAFVLLPFLLLLPLTINRIEIGLVFLVLPLAFLQIRRLFSASVDASLNKTLAATAALQLQFGLLFVIGLIL